jgi:hypothetical protein
VIQMIRSRSILYLSVIESGLGLMFRKRRRRRASSDGEGEGGSQRVQLACFWCRSKRVRCSGTKPVCEVSRRARVRVRRTRMLLHTVKRVGGEDQG